MLVLHSAFRARPENSLPPPAPLLHRAPRLRPAHSLLLLYRGPADRLQRDGGETLGASAGGAAPLDSVCSRSWSQVFRLDPAGLSPELVHDDVQVFLWRLRSICSSFFWRSAMTAAATSCCLEPSLGEKLFRSGQRRFDFRGVGPAALGHFRTSAALSADQRARFPGLIFRLDSARSGPLERTRSGRPDPPFPRREKSGHRIES